jgi:hypothetical protein
MKSKKVKTVSNAAEYFKEGHGSTDRLGGLMVRVFGYRSRGPGSIPGTTKKK